MKKNVLALSITAALFGLTGGAQAMQGTLGGATGGTSLTLNGDGVGHALIVPYFSTQSGNATLLNLVNTDQVRGKAVKVRFRGAANSDDIFDFQVFLSPGDVWTANVSRGADGRSVLNTTDASCTKPEKKDLNVAFVTARLDTGMTADQRANGTREGYIEIFNMGDIPPVGLLGAALPALDAKDDIAATTAGAVATAGANPLFTAIKHTAGVAPCSGTAWTNLDTTLGNTMQWNDGAAATTTPRALGMLPPTTGLVGNWTIINTVGAAAWSGDAFAIQSVAGGAASTGNVVYWPQTGTSPGSTTVIDGYTADPLLRSASVFSYNPAGGAALYAKDTLPGVTAGNYDLPDLSTPYTAASATPLAQAISVTNSIAATAASNEFLTTSSIGASTDWVFSQPTRRYSVAMDYAVTPVATDDGRRFTSLQGTTADNAGGAAFSTTRYFDHTNTNAVLGTATNGNGRQVCVSGISSTAFDREETTKTGTAVIVSPSTPTPGLTFCGEATVVSINNGGIVAAGTGALKASVAVSDLDVGYKEGWLRIATPAVAVAAGVNGLPVLGASFVRAVGGSGGQTFGASYKHRFAR